MTQQRTQGRRMAALSTPLGDDKLLLRSFRGTDALSRLYHYEVEAFSEGKPVDPEQLLGQNATIRLETRHGKRYYNGYISQVQFVECSGGQFRYRLVLVPWLWFLTRAADCRIFQDKSVPDIVREVFQGKNFPDFKFSTAGSYPVREYTVQYRETDFNFVSRLLEHEGIYYYFEHENGKHTLVLTDAAQPPSPCPLANSVLFHQPDEKTRQEHLEVWQVHHEVQTGQYALTDFDFTKPQTNLAAKLNVTRNHAASDLEIFDYPGDYAEAGEGERYVRARIHELQAGYQTFTGAGDTSYLALGHTFKLVGHPDQSMGSKEFLITSLSHEVTLDDYGAKTGAAGGGGMSYSCDLLAIDATQPYVPSRVTPRPTVQGPQTAMVVGKSGEEIWTDAHGRVKVLFHWDHAAAADEKASCWIRVAQVWAGKGWGGMLIPRIGQEVIVDFLEGDPDRPIITGRVYNGTAKPPYDLPANKTVSTLKSDSSKGGGGCNELKFDDNKDKELLYLHAQKDLEIRAKNDRKETIEHDDHRVVQNDSFEHVQNDRHETIDQNHYEEIGADRNLTVKGKEAKDVTGTLSLTVTDKVEEEFGADHSEKTTGKYSLKAREISLEADTKIELKVGPCTITIQTSGVKFEGPQVEVNGSAMVKIQGGLVKIN